jgi:hypothetical protein
MNAGGSTRGGGSGRARGSGRGGGSSNSRGGANMGIPLAAQMRQVTRLQEPDEMAVLRRYRDIGASQVRSTYGTSGLLDRQIQIPAEAINRLRPNSATEAQFVPVLVADNALGALRQEQERERALARREVRLPEARRRASWGSLTPDERRILLLSQKEYTLFRASQGGSASATPAPAARPPAPARSPTPAK